MSYLVERDDPFYGMEGLNELMGLCEEHERIATVINRVECAARGHTVAFTSTTGNTADQEPPPGTYECLECGGAVTVEDK